jgi:hypothetical protein
MVRALARVAVVSAVAVAVPALVRGGVKTEQRTQVRFGGFLGGIVNKVGGKAAKEGVLETVAVVGDRKLTLGEDRGEVVDLAVERIYELDVKKKAYTVTTFAELKKRIEEQRAKAEKEAAEARREMEKEGKKQEAAPEAPAKEYEVDVEMSETGQKRPIAGREARQVTMKAWVHEKGKKIQQSGGLLVTTDTWLGPKVGALDEIAAFDRRYALKMAEILGFSAPAAAASAAQMASLVATYPQLQAAMEKVKAESEKVNMEGTTLASGLTITLWKSAAQMAEAQKQSDDMGGGLSGLLAKKLMKQGDPSDPRTVVLSSTTELLKIAPDATAADVALPAGYKQK